MPHLPLLAAIVLIAVITCATSVEAFARETTEKHVVDPTQSTSRPPHELSLPTHSASGHIPADELLREANTIQPRTEEGWIVNYHALSDPLVAVDPGERTYATFEYALRLRQFASHIRLAQAEIESWRRRLAVYSYFNQSNALIVTVENARLALLEATERLRSLRYERALFIRQHQIESQLQSRGIVVSQELLTAPDESGESQ